MTPAMGRIVHYVMPNGQHRPAMVVEDWPQVEAYQAEQRVNLLVFLDGENDRQCLVRVELGEPETCVVPNAEGIQCWLGNIRGWQLWTTSVAFDADGKQNTWHWPERKE
jgi:hypothetical protein